MALTARPGRARSRCLNVNTYTGITTISGGTLSISADVNLGTAPLSATPGALTINGGTLATTASLMING